MNSNNSNNDLSDLLFLKAYPKRSIFTVFAFFGIG